MKRLLALVFVVLLALAGTALANTMTDNYYMNDLEVDNVEIIEDGVEVVDPVVVVERGDSFDIELWLKAIDDVDELDVFAEVRDADNDKIETEVVTTSYLLKDQQTKVTLTLEFPDDFELNENEEDNFFGLTIEIEGSDSGDDLEHEFVDLLNVRAIKHKLEIKKVINVPTSARAGEVIEPIVMVENTGANKEEDIEVDVSICDAEMNCIASTGDIREKDLVSGDTWTFREVMKLKVPADAKTGDYNIVVEVTSEDTSVVKKLPLHVKGVGGLGEVEAIISLDTSAKQVAQGEEVAYKVTFANLGKEKVVYSVELEGADWATVKTEPAFVDVEAGKAAEMVAYLKANDNAPIGSHTFTLKVNANGEPVKEVSLNAEVTGSTYNWESTKKGLEVGFAVLVVILIILGLVVAFRRGRSKEADATEEAYY